MKHPVPGGRQRGWPTSWSTTSRRQPTMPDRSAPVMKDVIEVPGIGWFSIILRSDGRGAGPVGEK